MAVNRDFRDLLKELNDGGVDYLVVGAYAVIIHSQPRYTKDIDIWVRPTAANAERVFRALHVFGAPLQGITPADFTDPEVIYYMGVQPNRVDILNNIEGLDFDSAWANRAERTYGDVPIHVLGKADLIRAKRASGRPQDLLDVDTLEKTPDQ